MTIELTKEQADYNLQILFYMEQRFFRSLHEFEERKYLFGIEQVKKDLETIQEIKKAIKKGAKLEEV